MFCNKPTPLFKETRGPSIQSRCRRQRIPSRLHRRPILIFYPPCRFMHAPFSASRLIFPSVRTKRNGPGFELEDLLFCYYIDWEPCKSRNDRGNPEAFELIRLLILSSLPISRILICPGRILTDLNAAFDIPISFLPLINTSEIDIEDEFFVQEMEHLFEQVGINSRVNTLRSTLKSIEGNNFNRDNRVSSNVRILVWLFTVVWTNFRAFFIRLNESTIIVVGIFSPSVRERR